MVGSVAEARLRTQNLPARSPAQPNGPAQIQSASAVSPGVPSGLFGVKLATLVSNRSRALSRAMKLIVRWRDEFGRFAEYTEVRLDQADIRQTLTQDSQEFTVDSMRLVPTNEEHVTVTRTNKGLLQGGLDGSEGTATTQHRIAFKVQ